MPDAVVDVFGRLGSVARFSQFNIRGWTAHESAQRLRMPPTGSPSVRSTAERSLPSTTVLDEVLRLVPPRPAFNPCDSRAVRLPWEALTMFALEPDGVPASYVRTMMRWATVPEPLASLLPSVVAEFLVLTTSSTGRIARWWVSGDAGWVGLGLDAGEVVLVPSSLEDIARSLASDLAAAVATRTA